MTDLSPFAQAVRDAVLATYADNIPKDDNLWALDRASVVAALRAAADQVVPEYETTPGGSKIWPSEPVLAIRAALHAIAAELEVQ